jgi:hypothetical protein
MQVEDISHPQLGVLPDRRPGQWPVEAHLKSPENEPPDMAREAEYMPPPTRQPIWPRVFPGL